MKKALLISCFNWYKTRLEPIRELLLEKGYEVTILIADFDHITKDTVKERYGECTYIHVPEYKKNLSPQRILSHLSFGKNAGKRIVKEQPDLVYLQVPPNNTAKYCTKYKINHPETKLVVDIIDLWPESMPLGLIKKTSLAKKWKKWRDQSVAAADHVFTECALYQEKLKLDPKKASTLHLFKDQKEEEKELVQKIIRDKKDQAVVRFAYLGSMNNIIDIEGICKVIRWFTAKGKECELHAVGDGGSRGVFEEAVKATGCKAVFYGPVFTEMEKIQILTPCDFAFNMMKETSEVGLTIKSIDYLSYGLPLINNIKGDTWAINERYGLGINVKDNLPDDIPEERSFSRESIIQNSFIASLREKKDLW